MAVTYRQKVNQFLPGLGRLGMATGTKFFFLPSVILILRAPFSGRWAPDHEGTQAYIVCSVPRSDPQTGHSPPSKCNETVVTME